MSVRGLSLNSLSPAKGTTVLVVEDHPDSADAMRQILTTAGADEDDIRTEEFSGY